MVDKQPDRNPEDYITQTLKVKTLNKLADVPLIGLLSFDKALNALIDRMDILEIENKKLKEKE